MGLEAVIFFDLGTFALAAVCLLVFIPIPSREGGDPEPLLAAAREGLGYLKTNRGVLDLILFLAVINLTASMFNAALPALLIPKGGEEALGAGGIKKRKGKAPWRCHGASAVLKR